ncbi:MAG: glycosyltransferase family 4 protein, partial [Saprospiraceae bacterium]|nr:glycosyltransferase family 4 protein [Saprospiraceae bacterium]
MQKSGGISLYWYELIKNFPTQNVNIQFLENKKIDNLFRNQLNLQDTTIHHRSEPIIIDRFTPVRIHNDSIKPTIFHSSYYRRLRNKSENVKEVITLHDLTEIEYYNFTRYFHKKQIIKAIHQADGIICISNKTKSDLFQHFPEVNSKPIKVIHHGITSHYRILPKKELIRLTNKLELQYLLNKDNIVLYVGNRKAKYKNFLPMVKALKNTDYKLIIAGGEELSRKELILLNNNLP